MNSNHKKFICLFFLLILSQKWVAAETPTADIPSRDPFILAEPETGTYYWYSSGYGRVEVRKSHDLKLWTERKEVFTIPPDNWAKGQIWAAEVHKYNGRYYLFATVNSSAEIKIPELPNGWTSTYRAMQIFHSDSPEGPFESFSNQPHLPSNLLTLDGTLWVEDGVLYMVYCHEWLQMVDGTMEVIQLKPDLSATVGQPSVLFKASEAPWKPKPQSNLVTDGPFLYRTKTGKLLMIWSSGSAKGYAVGIAESATGKITGPWTHQSQLLYDNNGGHGSIFKTFDNKLYLVMHQPNGPRGAERARFFELNDMGNTLTLGAEM